MDRNSLDYFDLAFVANASSAVRLVMDMDSFKVFGKSNGRGFNYFYHVDAHNSVVEASRNNYHRFTTDSNVKRWLDGKNTHEK